MLFEKLLPSGHLFLSCCLAHHLSLFPLSHQLSLFPLSHHLSRDSMYVCMHACMYVCMYVRMHACMHVCMHVCVHACMYACMHACMHVCMYVCKLCGMCKRGCKSCPLCTCVHRPVERVTVVWHVWPVQTGEVVAVVSSREVINRDDDIEEVLVLPAKREDAREYCESARVL